MQIRGKYILGSTSRIWSKNRLGGETLSDFVWHHLGEGTEDEAEKVIEDHVLKDFNIMLIFLLWQVVGNSRRF